MKSIFKAIMLLAVATLGFFALAYASVTLVTAASSLANVLGVLLFIGSAIGWVWALARIISKV